MVRELSQEIYARMVSAIYKDISKADDADLRDLAAHCIRAAEAFSEVLDKMREGEADGEI
jgi:phytoene/squalene synthetase